MREPRQFWSDAPSEPWRVIAERKIREMIEAGAFDNLPGKGQPLDLEENPFLDPELRLPFKILSNAGITPEWIELGQKVEDECARWERFAEQQRVRHARAQARLRQMFGQVRDLAAQRLAASNERAVAEYANGLRELNHLIDRFNGSCPIFTLTRPHVPVAARRRDLAQQLGVE